MQRLTYQGFLSLEYHHLLQSLAHVAFFYFSKSFSLLELKENERKRLYSFEPWRRVKIGFWNEIQNLVIEASLYRFVEVIYHNREASLILFSEVIVYVHFRNKTVIARKITKQKQDELNYFA